MREAENIREVESIGIDLMGFIFWPKSSRYVSERPAYLPTNCSRVGVFVNEDIEQIKRTAHDYGLNLIQLHGSESPDFCQEVHQQTGLKIIKAISIDKCSMFNRQCSIYEGIADYFLFDTKGKSYGGNGTQFDWDILQHYKGDTPFLLSGGIGPEDAERLKHWHHPQCIGIDINSRFETAPALKDTNKIKTFINTIRTK